VSTSKRLTVFFMTPLLNAITRGHADIVRIMVDSGVDVDLADLYGTTPLLAASRSGHADIVRILVDNGVDVNGAADVLADRSPTWCMGRGAMKHR